MQCIVRASYVHNETVMDEPSLPMLVHQSLKLVHSNFNHAKADGEKEKVAIGRGNLDSDMRSC